MEPTKSYLRVATACPIVHVGNIKQNITEAITLYQKAIAQNISILVFPELSLTGYSLGDLFQQDQLYLDLEKELPRLLQNIAQEAVIIVGLPFRSHDKLYDVAAVVAKGKIYGLVPKQHLPNYKEFYEQRWFSGGRQDPQLVSLLNQPTYFGNNLLFSFDNTTFAIEICEDLWVNEQPSIKLAQMGAQVIINPSASPEQVRKSAYREQLVVGQSARLIASYLYAGCDASESTQDIVMSGHQLIATNGHLIAARQPLSQTHNLLMADLDIEHLNYDRRQKTDWISIPTGHIIELPIKKTRTDLMIKPSPTPFLDPAFNSEDILNIQSQALATHISKTKIAPAVLGLSGGLDSGLALLVCDRAAKMLQLQLPDIVHLMALPANANSQRTKNQAQGLAQFYNLPVETISIEALAKTQAKTLAIDKLSFAYGSIQARLRTNLLMNRAAQLGGFMLGTSDLSEIALGFSTFGGDHLSHYNVNSGVSKTLVKAIVLDQAKKLNCQVLQDIAATPISPELLGTNLSQNSEDVLGSYEINDFFLYHLIRWGESDEKIIYLAKLAFPNQDVVTLYANFSKRFNSSQWKRSVMPDGPKIGTVSLSPRGDWRMPSD